MSDNMNTYEGMFLVPSGLGDFNHSSEPIQKILNRVKAEVLSIKPWDERRLAYEINDQKRGLYILTYFKADPLSISDIEHESQLAEGILRVMILKRDRLTEDCINAETPSTTKTASDEARAKAAAAAEAAAAEAAAAEAAEAAAAAEVAESNVDNDGDLASDADKSDVEVSVAEGSDDVDSDTDEMVAVEPAEAEAQVAVEPEPSDEAEDNKDETL